MQSVLPALVRSRLQGQHDLAEVLAFEEQAERIFGGGDGELGSDGGVQLAAAM